MWRSALVLVLVLASPPGRAQPVSAHGRVALDIKTKLAEKIDLAAAKAGTIARLSDSGWARVVETGEDYSVWLRGYRREWEDGATRVSLVVELRTPALIRTGTLIASERVVVDLPNDRSRDGCPSSLCDEADVIGEEVYHAVRRLLRGVGLHRPRP